MSNTSAPTRACCTLHLNPSRAPNHYQRPWLAQTLLNLENQTHGLKTQWLRRPAAPGGAVGEHAARPHGHRRWDSGALWLWLPSVAAWRYATHSPEDIFGSPCRGTAMVWIWRTPVKKLGVGYNWGWVKQFAAKSGWLNILNVTQS